MDRQYNQVFQSDFSIEYKDTTTNELLRPHYHADYEIFLNLNEHLTTQIGDVAHATKQGTLLLFNNMDLHRNYVSDKEQTYRRYVLFFKPAYIQSLSSPQTDLLACFLYRPFEHSQMLPLAQEEYAQMIELFETILTLSNASPEKLYGKDILLKVKLAELLILINRLYCQQHHIQHSTLNAQYSRIYQVINFIHEHFQESLSLDLLEKKFFINKYHLCALFKAVTGSTINQYIVHCRITHAKTLLMAGIHVDDVCGQSGFQNLSHFSRSFKQVVGDSPKQFQIRMRQSETKMPSR